MVEYKTKDIYRCPYCHNEYEHFYAAEDCAKECVNVDDPVSDEKTIYICEFCKKEYNDEEDAEKCEIAHAENRDEVYSKEMLKRAANAPGQLKLGGFK